MTPIIKNICTSSSVVFDDEHYSADRNNNCYKVKHFDYYVLRFFENLKNFIKRFSDMFYIFFHYK